MANVPSANHLRPVLSSGGGIVENNNVKVTQIVLNKSDRVMDIMGTVVKRTA